MRRVWRRAAQDRRRCQRATRYRAGEFLRASTRASEILQPDVPDAAHRRDAYRQGDPGPGLISHGTTGKCLNHLPLYRQEALDAALIDSLGVGIAGTLLVDGYSGKNTVLARNAGILRLV